MYYPMIAQALDLHRMPDPGEVRDYLYHSAGAELLPMIRAELSGLVAVRAEVMSVRYEAGIVRCLLQGRHPLPEYQETDMPCATLVYMGMPEEAATESLQHCVEWCCSENVAVACGLLLPEAAGVLRQRQQLLDSQQYRDRLEEIVDDMKALLSAAAECQAERLKEALIERVAQSFIHSSAYARATADDETGLNDLFDSCWHGQMQSDIADAIQSAMADLSQVDRIFLGISAEDDALTDWIDNQRYSRSAFIATSPKQFPVHDLIQPLASEAESRIREVINAG